MLFGEEAFGAFTSPPFMIYSIIARKKLKR